MKKLFYHLLLCFIASTFFCVSFSSCKDDNKDEPEPSYVIPYFKLKGEKQWEYSVQYKVDAEAQTLSVVAYSNMDDVKIHFSDTAVWITMNEIVKHPESEQVEFIFDILANPQEAERIGYVIFSSPAGTDPIRTITPHSVEIVQAGK
ncbi:MAG: hypothetical protein K5856_02920 [Bacteroidaceae bacterium]|nr:hypothetical protein [Bacteroidaceae bacterium]